jgi:O-antigen ligase
MHVSDNRGRNRLSLPARDRRKTPRAGRGGVAGAPERADVATPEERLGVPFLLLLVWVWFEYGRPANPLGIPFLISAVLLIGWLLNKDKRWSRQSSLLVALLVVMAAGVPLATNTYSAFWALYGMATIFLCICVPMPSLVTSVRKIKIWIYTFVGVAVYVGIWAVLHGGYGPSGRGGGQDENYVAAMMGMAVSFAYFSIFAERRRLVKVILALSILIFLGAAIAGHNVSRGGFLGLCAVFLYCLARSPRKWIGLVVLLAVILAVLPFVGSGYWDAIATITDFGEGTADLRLEIWQIGVRMWQWNPILGVGAGNFRWVVGTYQSGEQLDKFGRDLGGSIIAHSLFVELIAELGTVGAIVLLLLLWRTWKDLREVVRAGQNVPDPSTVGAGDRVELRCYADAVIGGIVACLVNGIFLSLLYFSYLWLFVALGSAIWQVSRPRGPDPASDRV